MAKKVIKLTEEESLSMIHSSVHAIRVINNDNNGSHRFVEGNNGDSTTKATNLQLEAQEHWLEDYIGKTFNFFTEDSMNLVAHVLFTLEKLKKLDVKKTVLVGSVVFNNQQIIGDSIIIDFTTNRIKYREMGSRYIYNLEIDNRFKPLWNSLLGLIKIALENMR